APSALPLLRLSQRLVRPVSSQVRARKRGPVTQCLGCRSISLDCHKNQLFTTRSGVPRRKSRGSCAQPATDDARLQVLRVLRHLLAGPQPYKCLLPIRTIPGKLSPPPFFAREIRGAHRMYFHFKNRLHRLLDLSLGRFRRHLEDQRVLVFLDPQALLGNHRPANNLICGLHVPTLPPPLSWCESAGCASPSSAPSSSHRPRLRPPCARALTKVLSAIPAASQLPAAKKSRDHNAA